MRFAPIGRSAFLSALVIAAVATLAAAASVRAQNASAQNGSLAGTVARDSSGHMIGGVEIRLPQINRIVTTNYLGEFGIASIPAGRYAVTLRAVGFTPVTDTVEIKANAVTEREFILAPVVAVLDTVRTTTVGQRRLPPGLAGMEERRRAGQGGYFITENILRDSDARQMSGVISGRIPGVSQVFIGSSVYLTSGRTAGDGGPVFRKKPPGSVNQCFVTVYMDGVRIWNGPWDGPGDREHAPPPDFGHMGVTEYGGIEYYPGGASLPMQFNATGSGCGTLLLWTRDR
jgi:carboxypeptidase family protein